MTSHNRDRPVIYFDGICNLCNRSVQFVLKHDRKKQFLFASLQSETGRKALDHIPGKPPDSLILFYNGKYFVKSSAALRVVRLLGGFWSLLFGLIILPPFLRDGLYDYISAHRYKWFGKRDACMVPSAELNDRFL